MSSVGDERVCVCCWAVSVSRSRWGRRRLTKFFHCVVFSHRVCFTLFKFVVTFLISLSGFINCCHIYNLTSRCSFVSFLQVFSGVFFCQFYGMFSSLLSHFWFCCHVNKLLLHLYFNAVFLVCLGLFLHLHYRVRCHVSHVSISYLMSPNFLSRL